MNLVYKKRKEGPETEAERTLRASIGRLERDCQWQDFSDWNSGGHFFFPKQKVRQSGKVWPQAW